MTASENRRRLNALRAEENAEGKKGNKNVNGSYNSERRQRAEANKRRMGFA